MRLLWQLCNPRRLVACIGGMLQLVARCRAQVNLQASIQKQQEAAAEAEVEVEGLEVGMEEATCSCDVSVMRSMG